MRVPDQTQPTTMHECLPSDAVGKRVACDGERGTVRFVGTVPPTAGLWLGVEWDNPDRGKHDGSHEGVHYFTCRHPKGGSFVRPKKASFGVDYLTAIRRRYEMEVQQVLGEEIQISTRTVEMVGFELLECAPMWPLLEELYASENDITELQKPNDVLQSLTVLDLSTNPLVDGAVLNSVNYYFITSSEGCKTAMFPALKSLAVNSNNISEWSVINELEKLQSLVRLSCRQNPLLSQERNPGTAMQLLIARVGRLEALNRWTVLPEDRRGAELDYCKMFGLEWLASGGHRDPQQNRPSAEFTTQHPRYQSLIQKYGAPEDSELKKQEPFALKNQLLSITFVCPDETDRKSVVKKLPDSMIVQKVKGLLYRLLKIPGAELKLSYTSSKMEGKEIEIDNDLKPLQFYSIEDGDKVLVRWL
uniref:Tubulin-specific chaperone E n=1 Tax=Oncorhynchus tshawytscha TaxID=74940 RepID=A0AAZ3QLB5_ONCTS